MESLGRCLECRIWSGFLVSRWYTGIHRLLSVVFPACPASDVWAVSLVSFSSSGSLSLSQIFFHFCWSVLSFFVSLFPSLLPSFNSWRSQFVHFTCPFPPSPPDGRHFLLCFQGHYFSIMCYDFPFSLSSSYMDAYSHFMGIFKTSHRTREN